MSQATGEKPVVFCFREKLPVTGRVQSGKNDYNKAIKTEY